VRSAAWVSMLASHRPKSDGVARPGGAPGSAIRPPIRRPTKKSPSTRRPPRSR
jgi:hypothetical protein